MRWAGGVDASIGECKELGWSLGLHDEKSYEGLGKFGGELRGSVMIRAPSG